MDSGLREHATIRRWCHAGRRRLSAAPGEHQVRGSKLRDGDELSAGQDSSSSSERSCRFSTVSFLSCSIVAYTSSSICVEVRSPFAFANQARIFLEVNSYNISQHRCITRGGFDPSPGQHAGGPAGWAEGFRLQIMQSSEERTMAAGTHQQALADA